MNQKEVFIIGGVVLIAGGLGYYLYKERQLFDNISYDFLGITINNVSGTNINANVKLLFKSSVDTEAKIKNINLDVYIQGQQVGHITNVQPFIIPARANSIVDLNFDINPAIVLSSSVNVLTALSNAQAANAMVSLRGTAKIDSGVFTVTLPVTYDKTIS